MGLTRACGHTWSTFSALNVTIGALWVTIEAWEEVSRIYSGRAGVWEWVKKSIFSAQSLITRGHRYGGKSEPVSGAHL